MILFSKMTNYGDIVIDLGWIHFYFPGDNCNTLLFQIVLEREDMHYSKECNTVGKRNVKESMHVYKPVSNVTPCGYV